MNTEQGNELIADFMGWKHHEDEDYKQYEIRVVLKYHSSWDWLMPVVEKIKDIYNEACGDRYAEIKEAELQIHSTSIFCHKQAVYERVVEFIQWYTAYQASIKAK